MVCEYEATVNNYYDLGYCEYYGESEPISKSAINGYTYEVSLVFAEQLGLYLNYGVPQYFESDIDICKAGNASSDIDTLCTHSGTIHTDRDNVREDIEDYVNGSNKITNIYWTGHNIKSVATSGEVNYNRSCSWDEYILILRQPVYVREEASQAVLLHELCHQYGAPDHYHEFDSEGVCKFRDICSQCGENKGSEKCIMFDSGRDIDSNNIMCSGCKADMLEHLEDHH